MKNLSVISMVCLALVLFFAWSKSGNAEKREKFTPTVDLQVTVNGKLLTADDSVTLEWGDSIQLEVEAVYPDGIRKDVTRDPNTSYISQSPWNLTVTNTGLVKAESDPIYEDVTEDKMRYGLGGILALHGTPTSKDRGLTAVLFKIIREPVQR